MVIAGAQPDASTGLRVAVAAFLFHVKFDNLPSLNLYSRTKPSLKMCPSLKRSLADIVMQWYVLGPGLMVD